MGSVLSAFTSYLADSLCGGSSRKLIAGWWYAILVMTAVLAIVSTLVASSDRSGGETFGAIWSAIMLIALSVGGTMIMRKFHASLTVGFFMGAVVAMTQFFLLMFFMYLGHAHDRKTLGYGNGQERFLALLSLVEFVLLGSFATILAAHRSAILENKDSGLDTSADVGSQASFGTDGDYQPPN